jgi:nitrogen fixation NifU-like protein
MEVKPFGIYSTQVMEHFRKPKNMGKIENPDGVGKVGNLVCGDVMWLYIKIKENKKTGKKIISDIKFQTFGCVAAIATSSMVTSLAKGKTIEQALKITRENIAARLGGLPKIKMHCSVLATDALAEAIYNYLTKNKLPIPPSLVKTHQRIVSTLESLEAGHKDYLKFEEKVLKK